MLHGGVRYTWEIGAIELRNIKGVEFCGFAR